MSAGRRGAVRRGVQVFGDVGPGAVIINGAVTVSVDARRVDMRSVADTLHIMRGLDADQHLSVLVWMEREFGTQIVKELNAGAQRRLRAYAAAVLRSTEGG